MLWVVNEKGTGRIRIALPDEWMIVELPIIDSPHNSLLHWWSTMDLSNKFFLCFSATYRWMLFNKFDVFFRIHFELVIFSVLSMNNKAFCVVFSPIIYSVAYPLRDFMTEDGHIVSLKTFRI